ncbi:DNA cross-link repair protein SNM1 isoform X2 [Punica granatum]|uniref:DNA cross-link repair protein SNM1 isoform X2 n=1 Tax=Punica granatum TaxID=22663 RepID=A0A6P8CAG4_PUNGR|nr:DNA cross-link repair protein SNM1 isoform X2 [Punica granatum]
MRPAISPINGLLLAGDGDVEDETDCGGEWARAGMEDEDGLPSFRLLDSEDMGGSIDDVEDGGDGAESFSSSFYKSGTDWSRLRLEQEDGESKSLMFGIASANGGTSSDRKMKQTSLLHMWGLKRKEASDDSSPSLSAVKKRKEAASGETPGSSHSKRSKLFSMRTRMNNEASTTRPRACPFYKRIPGTPFTVDAFRYGSIEGCSAYFLTHFHADHYGGLSKGWSHGPIYCTPLTARLVRMCLSVNPSWIRTLEFNEERVIEGIKVTLLEANHCPGAALIHFRLSNGQCYLHTGDFRASKSMQAYPLLVKQRVNVLYLDTTYCNPKYKFPSREDVLNYVVRITKKQLMTQPRTLVVVGAYSIGKERVYLSISQALGVKIHATASRKRILQSFEWPELSNRICSNPTDTLLHVLPISSLRFEVCNYLKTYKDQYVALLAFRPTGWTFSEAVGNQLDLIRPTSKSNITIYGVPYSEHSSFTELREFVRFLRPEKIIPTVNVGNPSNREKMQSYFRQWLAER